MFRLEIPVHLFSPLHDLILASIPLLAWLLTLLRLRWAGAERWIVLGLSAMLLAFNGAYYIRLLLLGQSLFPYHLPLELCDISVWLTIVCLFWRSQAVFDIAYFWCLAGPTMALLTPNVTEHSVFLIVEYFISHGLTVAAILYLVWTGQMRPRRGALLKAFGGLNLLAIAVGSFDWLFNSDYMFLLRKPPTASLLDMFGPWPWYVLVCEGVALVLFGALSLPFLRRVETAEAVERQGLDA